VSDHNAITRRDFLRLSGAAAAGVTIGTLPFGGRSWAQPARPNVLLIITDQHHIDAVSAAGNRHISTPNLDALAARGTRFVQSYSANPLCSPARSAIFSGRPSSEANVYVNGRAIREDLPNTGQWLREQAGYETAYAGKWHLPQTYTSFVPGFETICTGIGGQGNVGDSSVSRACEAWLRHRSHSQPFMLVASFMQPHDICEWLRLNSRKMDELPYPELADELPPLPDNFGFDPLEPEPVSTRRAGNEGVSNNWSEQQWRYYLWCYNRHVEMVDAEIGRVLQGLEDAGHADDTLVIFTADHGEGTAHHQTTRKNSLYDEAARVPLIVSMPGEVPAGAVNATHVASGLDITPTICDWVGVDSPPQVRGRSLRPVVTGRNTTWREFCVTEVLGNRGRMVRTDRFKYVTYADDDTEQLFDMVEDPGELSNLADDASHAEVLRDHRAMLADWESRLDVPPDTPYREAWGGLAG